MAIESNLVGAHAIELSNANDFDSCPNVWANLEGDGEDPTTYEYVEFLCHWR